MLSRRLLRIKVVKALYAHFKSEGETSSEAVKALKTSIDSTYELYLRMLDLPVEVARYAQERIELGRKKKLPTYEDLNPNMRFVENPVLAQLPPVKKPVWSKEVVKHLYNLMVESPYYIKYMGGTGSDAGVLEGFFVETAQDNVMLEEAVEERSVYWADDLDFALSMAVKTLSRLPVKLLPQFKNDDDARFGAALLTAALRNYDKSTEFLGEFIENWNMERVAFMDTLIMVAALAEFTDFPEIPIKVTMDEYIEIAKHYSTPGSGTFINGVLDKAAEKLKPEKTGRGLL